MNWQDLSMAQDTGWYLVQITHRDGDVTYETAYYGSERFHQRALRWADYDEEIVGTRDEDTDATFLICRINE